MPIRLPNELIAEIAHFIPYKEKFDIDWAETFNFLDHPKEGPLLSSKALSIPNVKLLRIVKNKRKDHVIVLAQKMRKLLKERSHFWGAVNYKWRRYDILCNLGWYWDRPNKNEVAFCCICFNRGIYNNKELMLCNNSMAHTLHIDCFKSFNNNCLICTPIYNIVDIFRSI